MSSWPNKNSVDNDADHQERCAVLSAADSEVLLGSTTATDPERLKELKISQSSDPPR